MNSTGDHVMQMPWTYAGWPSLSIPTGKVDGLPVAVQLIAPPDADEVLLQLGAQLGGDLLALAQALAQALPVMKLQSTQRE